MKEYIITELQLKNIVETGAANAAMDLDIYVQPVSYDTSHGNEEVINTLDNMLNKINELKNMFNVGKKVHSSVKNEIFKIHDDLNKIFELIKKKV